MPASSIVTLSKKQTIHYRLSDTIHRNILAFFYNRKMTPPGNWVWTVWKRYEVSGTRPEIFFAPFGRGLRVNGGWRETNFWDVCKTQHFSFCLDIHAKHLGGGFKIQKYRNTGVFFELTRVDNGIELNI